MTSRAAPVIITTTANIAVPDRTKERRQLAAGDPTARIVEDDFDRRPHEPGPSDGLCPKHGPFFPIFQIDGKAEHPLNLVPRIESGECVLSDPVKASADLHDFSGRAFMRIDARAIYQGVIDAHHARQRAERQRRVRRAIGMAPDDDTISPTAPLFLSVQDVASIFGLDERTIRRQAGQSLPATVRIGGKILFKASAIAKICEAV